MSPNEPLRPDRTVMDSEAPPLAGGGPASEVPPVPGSGEVDAREWDDWDAGDDWGGGPAGTLVARPPSGEVGGAYASGEVPVAYHSGAYRSGAYSGGSGAYRSGQTGHVMTGGTSAAPPPTGGDLASPAGRTLLADRRLRFAGVGVLWLFSLVGGLVIGAVTNGDDPVDNPSTEIGDTFGDWSDAPAPGSAETTRPSVTATDEAPEVDRNPGGGSDRSEAPVTTWSDGRPDRPGGTTVTTEGDEGTSPSSSPTTTEDDGEDTSPTTSATTTTPSTTEPPSSTTPTTGSPPSSTTTTPPPDQ